jgi:hypothetical protein
MTLILVPYRDREQHLDIFIKRLAPLLKKHIINIKIVIIEQSHDNKKFNRGKVLNVGFKEYYKDFDYFFTHDVDTLPYENTIINLYNNRDYDIFRIHSGHHVSLGGIVKFKCDIFKKINGFPNNIWGWGLEDEALFTRAMINECNINSYRDLNISRKDFYFLPHISSSWNLNLENDLYVKNKKTNSSTIWRWGHDFNPDKLTDKQKTDLKVQNGIDDIEYKIINKEIINDYIEKIVVEI